MPQNVPSSRSALDGALPALLIFAVTLTLVPSVADVDLWGHVLFGRDIVATGTIAATDPYSFTADRPWVNHEWLAEVVMYGAYALGGGGGLTALRLLLIAAMLALIAYALPADRIPPRRRLLVLAFAAIITYTRTQHVRPQLFSLVLFAALLSVLEMQRRHPRVLWLVPAVMVFWVNTHGGWIVGLAVLGLWTAVQMFQARPRWHSALALSPGRADGRAKALRHQALLVLATSTVATLVNPYGAGLWSFLGSTVGLGRPDISEWHPIWRAEPGVMAFWSVTVLAAIAAVRRSWRAEARQEFIARGPWRAEARHGSIARRRLGDLPIVIALGVLSCRVSRLDAFFAIAVCMLLFPHLRGVEQTPGSGATREARSDPRSSARFGLRARGVTLAIACALAVRWQALTRIDLAEASWLPEAGAVRFVKENELAGNMLTFFDWGEYAIWHLSPRIKVSMDGRRETVYGSAPIENHLAIYRNQDSGVAYLRRLNPDFVWLPKNLGVVAELRSGGGWRLVYEGASSVVFARNAVVAAAVADQSGSNVRVFPGP